jgi:hypothetical protein
MNDFERSLKEQADEFRMIPSKRVWHGIYNDLHPGRRWPSITMSFLLIFTLLFIGYLNTHDKFQLSRLAKISSSGGQNKTNPGLDVNILNKQLNSPLINNETRNSNYLAAIDDEFGSIKSNSAIEVTNDHNNTSANNKIQDKGRIASDNPELSAYERNIILLPFASISIHLLNSTILGDKISIDNLGSQDVASAMNEPMLQKSDGLFGLDNPEIIQPIDQNSFDLNNLSIQKDLSASKKIDIGIGVNKKRNLRKKPTNTSRNNINQTDLAYFVTPHMSTVSFKGQPINPPSNINFSSSLTVNQKKYNVLHYQAFGFETGAQVNYRFAKRLALTAGFQISYSGYNLISNEVHPTFATLYLNDPSSGSTYAKNYISHYGDGTGEASVSLRNYSLQASIPVGLKYELWGNDKIQLNAAATFAPSLLIKGNAFVLSSDGNNYVNDPTLLRKWNMSSNFGLSLSFRSNKFRWQIGPDLRYQWLSTYIKGYPVQEHLIDYGIRIAISR